MVTINSKRPRERGAAAVEFALILPILLSIVLGIVEFGYLFFVQASVSGAARDAVRVYAIHNDTTAATTAARNAVPDSTAITGVTFAPNPCAPDSQATVVVSYRYSSLTGWFNVLGSNITLTGKGTMRCDG